MTPDITYRTRTDCPLDCRRKQHPPSPAHYWQTEFQREPDGTCTNQLPDYSHHLRG